MAKTPCTKAARARHSGTEATLFKIQRNLTNVDAKSSWSHEHQHQLSVKITKICTGPRHFYLLTYNLLNIKVVKYLITPLCNSQCSVQIFMVLSVGRYIRTTLEGKW